MAMVARPPPDYSVSEWADTHYVLPRSSSAEAGKFRTSRVPFMREIMDALTYDSGVEELAFMKATQIAGTTAAIVWILYTIHSAPAPTMVILPTGDLAQSFSRMKLQPSIDETPCCAELVAGKRSRDSGNTILHKEFPGGFIFMSGSNSPASFRSRSIRNLFLDDVDGFDANVGQEGDPVELARRRTDTFGSRRKIFLCSTPTTKGISRIEMAYNDSDQRRYHVPCPHCGYMQTLEWGGQDADFGIKFERDAGGSVSDVWYQCSGCHKRIDETGKTNMLAGGKWVPEHHGRERRGYQISSLYSPVGWVSWRQVVTEFLESKSDPERLQVWTNTRMGLPWDETGEQPDWAALMGRSEPYRLLIAPESVQILTAGIDVMDTFLTLCIYGWGASEEAWLLYFGEIYGDPAQPEPWRQVDEMLFRTYERDGGGNLSIVAMGIDTGGHCTQAVYDYSRRRFPQAMACKGASTPNKPVISKPSQVDVNYMGTRIKDGCYLWSVGTDTIKATIYSRLRISEGGPGCFHFPVGTPDKFFQELTAEKRITRYVKGFPRMEWMQIRKANHALDATVLAYAAATRSGVQFLPTEEAKHEGQAQQRKRRVSIIDNKRRSQWLNTNGKWL